MLRQGCPGVNILAPPALATPRILNGFKDPSDHYRTTISPALDSEDDIDSHAGTAKTARTYWDTAEKISENIKTHLSFVKDEKRRAYSP